MTKTRERLRTVAKKVARGASKAAMAAEKKVEAKLRQRKRERALKRAGTVGIAVGTAALAATAAGFAGRALQRRIKARRAGAIGAAIHLPVDMELATARVTDALRTEGFGVLTRIDVQATFQEKLGATIRPYLILGACNPGLAQRALDADSEAGLLLPCNVTLEEVEEGGTLVRIADPAAMLQVGELKANPVIREVAREAGERLRRVESHLAATVTAASETD